MSVGLPEAVDAFFDSVLVMAEDPKIRGARIGLVGIVAALGTEAVDWQELSL